jgi:SSS family solute:Na+ symporter
MQLITFLLFTFLVAIVSYYKSRKINENSADGYFLGGRSLTGVVIAGSLLLTNLSTEQIVGLNGAAYKEGILVMAWETLAAIAMVITAIYLLPRYLKGGITTVPQFLEVRYDRSTKTITSILFLSGYVIILLPIILYSGGLAISSMFDVSSLFGVSSFSALVITICIIGVIGSIYAIFGGLRAVAVSDMLNAIGLFIGGLLIPIFGLLYVGSGNVIKGITILMESHPEKFKSLGPPDSSLPAGTIFTGLMLVQLFYWGTNQAIIQRALGAKSLKEGQKGMLLAAFVKVLGPLIVVLPGIIAFHIFGNSLSNPDEAYPMLVAKVLPKALVGFFAAVLFGAILSSFNSALNSSITLFSVDIYKSHISPNSSERQMVSSGKKFGLVLAILSICIAPLITYAPEGLFGYLQKVNGCYTIPILTIVLVGYFTKHVPAIAAKIGIISGSLLYLIYVILDSYVLIGTFPHFLYVSAILFVFNILLMLLIGRYYPQKKAYFSRYTNQVDIVVWKYIRFYGLLICSAVLAIYSYFA